MKVRIIYGPNTDKVIHKCYDYILKKYRKKIRDEEEQKMEQKDKKEK
ncbi:hypothetical protein P4654_25455 [Niallia taxi]|nr:hypothetical protein [Niallia taxi]MED4118054.1 hypothetical protein [Niallia taxi]